MNEIKAIETVYNGYRFRSRLEARWAVYFDALGVDWEYEPEGFDLGGYRYLPDFYVPAWDLYVEVKPDVAHLGTAEQIKINRLALLSKRAVLVMRGSPQNGGFSLIVAHGPHQVRRVDSPAIVRCYRCGGFYVLTAGGRLGGRFSDFPTVINLTVSLNINRRRQRAEVNWKGTKGKTRCVICAVRSRIDMDGSLVDAICAANSSRFEFGETPVVSQ